ncbi:MAG: type II toxin-antitoxin system RelE/ParE family toxin [Solirubrobacterales bacterium]
MPSVAFTELALAQLEALIERHELPDSTRPRVVKSVRHLEEFPDSGTPLSGAWAGYRFVLGPWDWMLIVYFRLDEDRVAIVAVEDSRTVAAATNPR